MRKRPILLGTLLIVIALAIQINYDTQFKALIFGATLQQGGSQIPADVASRAEIAQRIAGDADRAAIAQRVTTLGGAGSTTDAYIRFSSYLIGTAAVMSILVGALLPEKKAEET